MIGVTTLAQTVFQPSTQQDRAVCHVSCVSLRLLELKTEKKIESV